MKGFRRARTSPLETLPEVQLLVNDGAFYATSLRQDRAIGYVFDTRARFRSGQDGVNAVLVDNVWNHQPSSPVEDLMAYGSIGPGRRDRVTRRSPMSSVPTSTSPVHPQFEEVEATEPPPPVESSPVPAVPEDTIVLAQAEVGGSVVIKLANGTLVIATVDRLS